MMKRMKSNVLMSLVICQVQGWDEKFSKFSPAEKQYLFVLSIEVWMFSKYILMSRDSS